MIAWDRTGEGDRKEDREGRKTDRKEEEEEEVVLIP